LGGRSAPRCWSSLSLSHTHTHTHSLSLCLSALSLSLFLSPLSLASLSPLSLSIYICLCLSLSVCLSPCNPESSIRTVQVRVGELEGDVARGEEALATRTAEVYPRVQGSGFKVSGLGR